MGVRDLSDGVHGGAVCVQRVRTVPCSFLLGGKRHEHTCWFERSVSGLPWVWERGGWSVHASAARVYHRAALFGVREDVHHAHRSYRSTPVSSDWPTTNPHSSSCPYGRFLKSDSYGTKEPCSTVKRPDGAFGRFHALCHLRTEAERLGTLMGMRQRVVGGLLVVAVVVIASGLAIRARPRPAPGGAGPLVVTSTPALYSLTAKVLGADGTLQNLVPPGGSPENYALRPQDADALASADVIVVNGLDFERFLADAVADAERRGVRVIRASANVPTRGTPPDPHVWVDPVRAARMVETIAAGLAEADPAHAAAYRERVADAQRALEALDAEFRAALAPPPRRAFVAFHPAWGYFAERYGLEQVAVIEETPGREPTAQELAAIVDVVRATGVRALFGEPQFSPRIVEALARDLGLSVHEVNPEGGELTADGYERFMRENVRVFVRALSE